MPATQYRVQSPVRWCGQNDPTYADGAVLAEVESTSGLRKYSLVGNGQHGGRHVSNESPGFAVAAVLVAALNAPTILLADFFDQERGLARGAGFWDRTVP